jgi:hypothetical protein
MAWRPHGRARVNSRDPSAFGVCDRCGMWYNLSQLQWQMQWAGNQLVNLRLLVCTQTCLDVPQQQLRSVIIPGDPPPVRNPRPQDFDIANNDYRVTQADDRRITQDDSPRVTQENGDDMEIP